MESAQETPKLTQIDENSPSVNFNKTKWNCITSKKFLACYFEYIKEQEEDEDEFIRSKPMEDKKLVCSTEEYQQSFSILWQNTWRKQFCECFKCLKMYGDQNVNFQFGIKTIECLPTEILLTIFTSLSPADRRFASESCKRFLEIWLCDDFNDDRRLVFDKCVLDPEREPLSVFMKSLRNYRTLVFGEIEMSGEWLRNYRRLVFGEIEMSGESVFAGKCWENVTTIELKNGLESSDDEHVNQKLSLLSRFPNLKTIKVAYIEQLGDFSNLPTTIELLVISDRIFDEVNLLMSYLDRTSDSFRAELNYDSYPEDIPKFTESQRKKIKSFHLNLEDYHNTFKLPRFESLKYLELKFDVDCEFGTKEILDNLEEQCPALKDLSINIWKRFPHKIWTSLKTLTAWKIPKEEMSRLSIFTNLKKLSLTIHEKCFFGHDVVLNNNLKTLDTHFFTANPCFTCFQTMTKSFPNLESIICGFQVANNHLEEFAANTPKLKSLSLGRVDDSVSFPCLPNLTELRIPSYNKLHDIEALPIMLRLRRLEFGLSCLNFETIKIFERMPAVEDLTIRCNRIDGDQLALFDAMTKPLKRLKKIIFRSAWIHPIENYQEIIDAMANNCKYLRRINFNNENTYQSYASQEILKLLQKNPSIRCIDDVWLK